MSRGIDLSNEKALWDRIHEINKDVSTLKINESSIKVRLDNLQLHSDNSNKYLIERQDRHETKAERTSEQLTAALIELKSELQDLISTIRAVFVTIKYCSIVITAIIPACWAVYTFVIHV
jgi:hypothetical protein